MEEASGFIQPTWAEPQSLGIAGVDTIGNITDWIWEESVHLVVNKK
jgi:hypothetical protein